MYFIKKLEFLDKMQVNQYELIKARVGSLRPAGRIRPPMRNRPARDISISNYKNTARRFLLSFKLQC